MEYSVLMSVYHKEKPQFLQSAMESILQQTIPCSDFVLVCDGPLTPELDQIIEQMQSRFGAVLQVIRLEKNVGLGNALNEGILHCRYELIARMDSDDISLPDRCSQQLQVFASHPDLSICSGIVEEFSSDPSIVDTRRVLPETHEEILRFAGKRNPFNHPCVMYKKTAVLQAGSYQDFYLLEDYYLWLRMLLNGCTGYNLPVPLLRMRAGSEMYQRRSGWRYARSQQRLFRFMKEQKLINSSGYLKSVILRSGSSLAPNWLRKIMFLIFLRK